MSSWGKRFAELDANGKWLVFTIAKGEKVSNAAINNSFDKSTTDLAVIGNAIPKLYAAWSNTLS